MTYANDRYRLPGQLPEAWRSLRRRHPARWRQLDPASRPRRGRHPIRDEPALLDCVRVPVVGPRPEPHQPENWLVGADSWRLIGRVEPGQAYTFLRNSLSTQGPLFGQPGDRIAHAVFAQEAARSSLVLIEPSDLRWQITTTLSGRRQTRARFSHANFQYDLSVTDPRWEAALAGLGLGTFRDPPPGMPPAARSLMTVSLGEPFDGNCYKLVAAVIRCA